MIDPLPSVKPTRIALATTETIMESGDGSSGGGGNKNGRHRRESYPEISSILLVGRGLILMMAPAYLALPLLSLGDVTLALQTAAIWLVALVGLYLFVLDASKYLLQRLRQYLNHRLGAFVVADYLDDESRWLGHLVLLGLTSCATVLSSCSHLDFIPKDRRRRVQLAAFALGASEGEAADILERPGGCRALLPPALAHWLERGDDDDGPNGTGVRLSTDAGELIVETPIPRGTLFSAVASTPTSPSSRGSNGGFTGSCNSSISSSAAEDHCHEGDEDRGSSITPFNALDADADPSPVHSQKHEREDSMTSIATGMSSCPTEVVNNVTHTTDTYTSSQAIPSRTKTTTGSTTGKIMPELSTPFTARTFTEKSAPKQEARPSQQSATGDDMSRPNREGRRPKTAPSTLAELATDLIRQNLIRRLMDCIDGETWERTQMACAISLAVLLAQVSTSRRARQVAYTALHASTTVAALTVGASTLAALLARQEIVSRSSQRLSSDDDESVNARPKTAAVLLLECFRVTFTRILTSERLSASQFIRCRLGSGTGQWTGAVRDVFVPGSSLRKKLQGVVAALVLAYYYRRRLRATKGNLLRTMNPNTRLSELKERRQCKSKR